MIKTILLILLTYLLGEKYYFSRKDKFIAYVFLISSLGWIVLLIFEITFYCLKETLVK
jgi:hypothetical protein